MLLSILCKYHGVIFDERPWYAELAFDLFALMILFGCFALTFNVITTGFDILKWLRKK